MKIAFTGSSSTGKTTLANTLKDDHSFKFFIPYFVKLDARQILQEKGFQSMDEMSPYELKDFQLTYLSRKIDHEYYLDNYLTDRSFIDLAAYWLEQVCPSLPECYNHSYIEYCFQKASLYDVHFYFPYGLFNFESDGYRSENQKFHLRIDNTIQSLISKWNIETYNIDFVDLNQRSNFVIDFIKQNLIK